MVQESLLHQTLYGFGLRAMKSVLMTAGQLIREQIGRQEQTALTKTRLLISSVTHSLFPKLLAHDLSRLQQIMVDVFSDVQQEEEQELRLTDIIKKQAALVSWESTGIWLSKITQLFYFQRIAHRFMLVGPSGTGKSSARTVLRQALEEMNRQEVREYVINPKSITNDTLFGTLDPISREWTDSVFTRTLRVIVANQRDEMRKRHWIVFDGDVGPEWVENLNSVLDDNKLLTLKNGERINLPQNA
jgi:dynein heavy chain 1